MKKIDLGQTVGIFANMAVLFGVLLLVYELSQNRQLMQAQTRNELSQTIVDQFFDGAANENLAALVLRGQTGRLQSELDERRYEWWLRARFRYWENVHYQYRLGLYDEEEFSAQAEAFISAFQTRGYREFWDETKSTFSPEFVSAVDVMLLQETAK